MAEHSPQHGAALLKEVAAALRASLNDPRRLAEALLRARFGCSGRFLGEGTRERPWLVFDRAGDFYALYLRGRELVQMVHGRPDEVVCAL
jgi:hypothetical protein